MTNLQSQIVAMDTIMRSGFEALGYSASSDSVSLKMGGTLSVSAALEVWPGTPILPKPSFP